MRSDSSSGSRFSSTSEELLSCEFLVVIILVIIGFEIKIIKKKN
jgi:hypothetical protein